MKHNIAILGAGGYTGKELLRILLSHPYIQPIHITSDKHKGKELGQVFPEFYKTKFSKLIFSSHEELLPSEIPVILATPNKESMELVNKFYNENRIIIDLSGAYRIKNIDIFRKFYNLEHKYPDIIQKAVYGMPEIYRETIKKSKIIANPGCYPTSILIPLYFFKKFLPEARAIIINSLSGISGAGGRAEDAQFSFASIYENTRAYKILKHQHEPEIQQYLYNFSNFQSSLVFTPHLLPAFRGILSTITILWDKVLFDDEELKEKIREDIQIEDFIRLYSTPEEVEIQKVIHTNFCDFSFCTRDGNTVLVSAIDNLVKGAAGQAIQNLNLTLNIKESTGLIS